MSTIKEERKTMQIGLTPLTLISPCTAPHSRRHPHPHHLQSHTSPCIMYTLTGGPTPPGVYKLLPRSTLPKTPTPPSIAHLPLHHVYTHRWPYTPGVYKPLHRSTLPKTPTPPSIAHLPLHHVYTHRWPYTPRRVHAPAPLRTL